MSEKDYMQGKERALLGILQHVHEKLGQEDTAAAQSKWIVERAETVLALRSIFDALGDNDWPDDLYLPDIVGRLENYLDQPDS